MNASGWIQLGLFIAGLALITKPMGIYLLRVLDPDQEGGMGILEKILGPVERLVYWYARVDKKKQQNWKQYTMALLIFGLVSTLMSYGLYRFQDVLPIRQNMLNLSNTTDATGGLNGKGKISAIMAFIQSVSFSTNTDWQSYEPEQTFTYFSQTVSTACHFFFSAAVGIAVAAVLVRAVARKQTPYIGNFWVDLTRITLYIFVPICLVYSLLLVWQGTPMNFKPYTAATTLDQSGAASPSAPTVQTIAQGPMASYCAPKVLGLNGPGFTGADCAHPYENPTPLSEFLQWMLFFSIIGGLPYYYGKMIKNTRHGWNIWAVMLILLLAGVISTWYVESAANPRLTALGIDPAYSNMEGKEVRIGIYNSAAWASCVTATAEGANNCQHDSMTPLAGFILMFNMHLGEVAFGGIGSGLYTMLIFIFVSVFLAGLMIGRTPEYLGKKVEGYDVKLAALFLLLSVIVALGMSAWAVLTTWGASNVGNGGPHGFSEILYAYSSGVANNGTAFGGYGYTPTAPDASGVTQYGSKMFNITQTLTMLMGRYFEIIPVMALAGSLAMKKPVAVSKVGTFPVTGVTFVLLITSVILIVGALNFFPSLAVGPLVEHFLMTGSKVLYNPS